MKTLLFLLALPLMVQAGTFHEYLAKKKETVSNDRHLPYQLSHGHKTRYSVLLIHGIYSSPLYFKGMAQALFKAGYNVTTILLPGHWDKDFESMKKIKESDWSAEAEIGFELAAQMGDQVILAGHSLGGLLSEELAQSHPYEVAGLFLVSPALKVWPYLVVTCRAGTSLGLSGNQFYRRRPDGITVPFYYPYAAVMIEKLASRVRKNMTDHPVYLAYTWNDLNVDIPFVRNYVGNLPAPLKTYVYAVNSGISHGDISQGPTDLPTDGNHTNPDFDQMMSTGLKFLHEQGL